MGVKEAGSLVEGAGDGPGPPAQGVGVGVPALRRDGAVDGGVGSRAGVALRLHLRPRGSWVLSRVEFVAVAYFNLTQSTEGFQTQSYHPLAPSSPPLRPQGQKAKAQATHSGILPPCSLVWPLSHLHRDSHLFCPKNHPLSVSHTRLRNSHSVPLTSPHPHLPPPLKSLQSRFFSLLEPDPHHQEVNFLIIWLRQKYGGVCIPENSIQLRAGLCERGGQHSRP